MVLDGVLDSPDGGRIDRWNFYHPGVQRELWCYMENMNILTRKDGQMGVHREFEDPRSCESL
jgi:hypothetical protein